MNDAGMEHLQRQSGLRRLEVEITQMRFSARAISLALLMSRNFIHTVTLIYSRMETEVCRYSLSFSSIEKACRINQYRATFTRS